jgi:hypothetical protein
MDEDAMARALVSGLKARGIDVTTVFEKGMSGKTDLDQLEYCVAHDRVLYSFERVLCEANIQLLFF